MQALTIEPGQKNSGRLEQLDKPILRPDLLLVRSVALGICGTDFELIDGEYGWAPPHSTRLIIGHESLGRVEYAPPGSGFAPNDLVVGIVRRPDPLPCSCCAAGEWDMCRNGGYTERGIKEIDGFGAEWFGLEPAFTVRVDPQLDLCGVLIEPASVVAKAWDQIERISLRSRWKPRNVLITGAGPVGLLGALLATQLGLDTHVIDVVKTGIKPELVQRLGATYHCDGVAALGFEPDIVLECTGVVAVIEECLKHIPPCGILCLLGVSALNTKIAFDMGSFNRNVVLENEIIFGSVNANRRHYELAAKALAAADKTWLDHLITRKVPLAHWQEAFERRNGDVKTIIHFEH